MFVNIKDKGKIFVPIRFASPCKAKTEKEVRRAHSMEYTDKCSRGNKAEKMYSKYGGKDRVFG